MNIVLVEPSRIGRRIVAEMLEARGDSVRAFGDGQEAFEYLRGPDHADILLTSLEVPGKSGFELCWELAGHDMCGKELYTIAMSSSREIDTVIEVLDCGADDFIRKPPLKEELYAKLRSAERLLKMQTELRKLATLDSLTGLYNRRFFLERAQYIFDDTLCDTPVSVIMLDIDHFKNVNDSYGHDAGDAAICAVSDLLLAGRGIAGRLGGEEFAVVLPISTVEHAKAYAEELRLSISHLKLEADGQPFRITSSFGVSQWFNSEEDRVGDVLKRADVALYAAKRGGRNRIEVDVLDLNFVAVEDLVFEHGG